MRALRTESPGGWAHTAVVETDEPQPRPTEVLLAIRAAGLNPADYFLIEGRYPGGPRPPFITGRDAAGTVLVRDAAGRWPAGSSVLVLQHAGTNLAEGTFCERQRFPAESLAPIPAGWSFDQAGAAPLAYLTAWQAIEGLKRNQTLLVTGASGGVGLAAVQLGLGLGALVIALSRSDSKRDRLLKLGAQHVFAPDADDLKSAVGRITNGRGIDQVVETVGGPFVRQAVHLLGRGGILSLVGVLAGVEGSFSIPSILFKRATIRGILVSDATAAQSAEAWTRIVEVLARIDARPIVEARYPLDSYQDAFTQLRAGVFGKVVFEFPASR